jgi:acetyl-CoA C-acetyltransferase/acetyl-CoA acyltransferase
LAGAAGVGVSAAGMVRVDRHYDKSIYDLAVDAVDDALRDSGRGGIDFLVVSTAVSRILTPQLDVASYLASHLGLRGSRAVSVEAGEAGGLAALQTAVALAAGGFRVLVVGVDKLTDAPSARVYSALKHVYYRYGDGFYRIGHAAVAGMLARLYMERYGVPREHLAAWPAMMHMHAKRNPYAMLRFAVKPESVASAMPVAEPLTLLDMFPLGDGAAAVLVERGGGWRLSRLSTPRPGPRA